MNEDHDGHDFHGARVILRRAFDATHNRALEQAAQICAAAAVNQPLAIQSALIVAAKTIRRKMKEIE